MTDEDRSTTARLRVVDPQAPDAAALAEAAGLLRAGRLVAFPTETVYGLGAHALDAAAVRRIFTAKGRPAFNPLIVHVPSVDAARALVTAWPPVAQALAERFWPGPLTLVLPKRAVVPDEVTAGRGTVALRIPAHPVARALLEAAAVPVAAPSANRFTQLSPVTATQVAQALGDAVDLILDGGRTTVGIESTVVDCSVTPPVLLRPGTLTRAALEAVAGPLADPAPPESAEAPRAAPGMIARHYAPRSRVELVAAAALGQALTSTVSAAEGASRGAHGAEIAGAPIGVVTWSAAGRQAIEAMDDETGARGRLRHHALPADADGYAAALYATLHAVDDARCTVVLIEQVPEAAAWDGVRDRLARAAHS